MTLDGVLEIIHRETEDGTIDFLDPLSAMGDSLELLSVVGKLEAAGGRIVPDKMMVSFETVGQLAEWVAG